MEKVLHILPLLQMYHRIYLPIHLRVRALHGNNKAWCAIAQKIIYERVPLSFRR